MEESAVEALAAAVARGERRGLARGITLVESTRADHRRAASALLRRLAGRGADALRVGLSGTPGVGKSTFIEALGLHLVEAGHRVAVLAVDPSSARSGGAILGDKTRMERLSRSPSAFIRPSPSGTTLGGVARRTREAIGLVEAAGFDVVLVETVGVGQSEAMVAEMTDVFALLLAPGGGDELQGVKRGIMEVADLVVINKADGPLAEAAEATRADYASALRLMRTRPADPEGIPAAVTVSAVTGRGIPELWHRVADLDAWRRAESWRDRTRARQARAAMRRALADGAVAALERDPRLAARTAALEADLDAGRLLPEDAADELLALFLGRPAPARGAGPD
jgi:LAO/AO transport system kinase